MTKKLNIAIVGLGFGAEFIPIYQRHPNANMYAICQRNEEKLNQIGDAFGIQARYTSFDKTHRGSKRRCGSYQLSHPRACPNECRSPKSW